MKRTIKLVAVFVIIATLALSLVSCGKMISGTYANSITTYEFSGNKFTRESEISAGIFSADLGSVEGTYKIEEDQKDPNALVIILTYEKDGEEKQETYSFSEGEEDGVKYIKIGGTKYDKQ